MKIIRLIAIAFAISIFMPGCVIVEGGYDYGYSYRSSYYDYGYSNTYYVTPHGVTHIHNRPYYHRPPPPPPPRRSYPSGSRSSHHPGPPPSRGKPHLGH